MKTPLAKKEPVFCSRDLTWWGLGEGRGVARAASYRCSGCARHRETSVKAPSSAWASAALREGAWVSVRVWA